MSLLSWELGWYGKALYPIILVLSNRYIGVRKIAICECGTEISLICDNSKVISVDNQSFECIYSDEKLKGVEKLLSERVRIFCNKLDCFLYSIRQIVISNPSGIWKEKLPVKGELTRSVEKFGERVVILLY